MAEVKWIKLSVRMFDNQKIKRLRRLPGGNDMVFIWVQLLCLAGKCNAGGMIFLTENIPYTPEDLADEFGFSVETIKSAFIALESLDMISFADNAIYVNGWEEHQNIEGMDRIREKDRLRKAEARAKQKLLTGQSTDVHGQSTDIPCIEEDKEEERRKKNKKENTSIGVFQSFAGDNKSLLDALNAFSQMRTKIKKPLTEKAKELLLNDLTKLTSSQDEMVNILYQSVYHSWQGVYALKNTASQVATTDKSEYEGDFWDGT